MGTTNLTTPIDPAKESSSSIPAFHAAGNLLGDPDTMKYIEGAGPWGCLEPMPKFLSILGSLDFDENDAQSFSPLPSQNKSQIEIVPLEIPTGTDRLNNLRQAAVEIGETLMLMDSSKTKFHRDQLLRTQEQLHEINEHISLVLHSTKTVVSAPTSTSLFKCRKCGDKATFNSVYLMRRHANDVHYPEFHYRCAECDFVAVRRHRLNEHIHKDHHRFPNPGEIDENKSHLPFPPFCDLCSCEVDSWKEFYRCFISHCIIGVPPSNAWSSRRPSLAQSIDRIDGRANHDQTHAMEGLSRDEGVRGRVQRLVPEPHADSSQYLRNPVPTHPLRHQ